VATPHDESRDGVVLLALKVVPGASRSRVVGRLGDRWKVAVCAAAERGAANEEVVRVLAEALRVRPSAVRVVSGRTTPKKTVAVTGAAPAAIEAALLEASA
jgi:uncharacterized protein (TIGR00251 family)